MCSSVMLFVVVVWLLLLLFVVVFGLLALISLGHWLEARARQAAGSAIRELLDLSPVTALRLRTSGDVGASGSGK